MRLASKLIPLALVPLVAASCSTLAVAAATVNGQRISERSVEDDMVLLKSDPAFGDAFRRDPNVARGDGRRQVLTNLIYVTVVEQQATRRHIRATPAQVDRVISERASSEGLTTDKFLRQNQITLTQARTIAKRIVLDFAVQERVLRNVAVSDEAIKRAYDASKERLVEAHLLRITLKSSSAVRDALTKLGAGTDFAELAREQSTDQLKGNGGDMGFVPLAELSPAEQGAIDRAKPGGVTDPVPTQTAFEIFKVLERRTRPLSEVAGAIRSSLERSQRDQTYRSWLRAHVLAAKVVVNPQYGRFDRRQGQVVRGPTGLRP